MSQLSNWISSDKKLYLSHEMIASGSDIMPFIKNVKPLMVYRFW